MGELPSPLCFQHKQKLPWVVEPLQSSNEQRVKMQVSMQFGILPMQCPFRNHFGFNCTVFKNLGFCLYVISCSQQLRIILERAEDSQRMKGVGLWEQRVKKFHTILLEPSTTLREAQINPGILCMLIIGSGWKGSFYISEPCRHW